MHRNSLCAKGFAVLSKLLHIRQIATARITQGSYFVDIYTQSGHNRCKGTKKNTHTQDVTTKNTKKKWNNPT
jgi:hypothetical protein